MQNNATEESHYSQIYSVLRKYGAIILSIYWYYFKIIVTIYWHIDSKTRVFFYCKQETPLPRRWVGGQDPSKSRLCKRNLPITAAAQGLPSTNDVLELSKPGPISAMMLPAPVPLLPPCNRWPWWDGDWLSAWIDKVPQACMSGNWFGIISSWRIWVEDKEK